MRRQHPLRRPLAALLLTLMGCTTVRPVPQPQQYVQRERPLEVWISPVVGDTNEVVVYSPRVYLDSIYGYSASGDQLWFAAGNVRHMRAKQPSMARSGLLLGAIAAIVVTGLFTLSGGGDSREREPIDIPDLGRWTGR